MKKISLYIFLVLMWCNVGFAENNWEIEEQEKSITVRTEGTTQKGDRLTFWISKNGCNTLEHTFTFYTMKAKTSIKKIEGKDVSIKSLGHKTLAELKYIMSTEPYMSGNSAFFSIGHYKLDEHIKFLEKYENFDVKLDFIFVDKEHTKGWDALDFFDILDNSWNLKGVREALNKGKAKCEGRQ